MSKINLFFRCKTTKSMGLKCIKSGRTVHGFLLILYVVSIVPSVTHDKKHMVHVRQRRIRRSLKSSIFFEPRKIPDAISKYSQGITTSTTDSNDAIPMCDTETLVKICHDYLKLLDSVPNVNGKCDEVVNCSCMNHSMYGLIVDCSNRNFNSITSKFPNETSVLLLNGNQIENITYGVFQNLQKLKYLDISSNNIQELSNSSFLGIEGLCVLKLNVNQLRYTKENIPDESLVPLKHLIYLDLQQNLTNISTEEMYPSVAISALTNLQYLHIDGLGDKHFQEEFKQLRMLSRLNMVGGRCQMNTIGKDKFSNFPCLKSLTVVNCNVSKVENESFTELLLLDSLDLSYNTNLTFASLTNITFALRERTMHMLNVTKIHSTFGDCTRLETANMRYMKSMTIKNLILDSNRLAVLTMGAARNIPKLTGMLSVKDNLLLLGKYVFILAINKNLTSLISLNLANQMLNHNLSDLVPSYQHVFSSNTQNPTWKNLSDTILNPTENRRRVKRYLPLLCQSCSNITHAIPYHIPKNIKNIDMSNMKSRYPLQGVCFCEPNSVRKLDLHRNVFYRVEGHFHGLSKLEWLDFSSNFCENISANVLHTLPGLLYLNLSNNYLGQSFKKDMNGNIFSKQGRLKTLNLSDNRISSLPSNFFSGLINIENLILKLNLMTEFEVDLKKMKKLHYIDLSSNILLHLSDNMIKDLELLAVNNLTMDLSKNNFLCNCKHLNVLKWISESKINFKHMKKYTCKDEDGYIRNMSNAHQLYAELSKYCKSYTLLIIISSSTLVLVLTVIIACILYRYRWNLRYIYYSGKIRMKGFIPIKDDDNYFDHDVFVSFANENNSFVRDFTIPELEEKRHLRLLLHDRDFRPGEFVHDNIVKAICTSRKTLIVMSDAFLQSIWCRFEMHMARMEAIKTGRNVLTLVLLEDVPTAGLPLEIVDIIRQQTYLEFPHENEHREQFWERLFEALK